MKYQKPKVVAKSAPKQSFVAGCPEKNTWASCTKTPKGACEYRSCMITTAH